MADLLDVAARALVMGGRLAYIIPSMADFNPETDLPVHPCLQLTYCCYQPLHIHYGRRVVVMKKKEEYVECQQEHYKASTWINGAESAEKTANIRERLLEEAKRKPGYEEKSKYKAAKRRIKKEEQKIKNKAK
jgi:tRNA (guanine10-N2)-methyltransferase